jgi:hypothetical protein
VPTTTRADRDRLVFEGFAVLADDLRRGKVPVDAAGSKPAKWSTEHIPAELVPFVQDRTIEALRTVLERRPLLFWHPFVRKQVWHLFALQLDADLADDRAAARDALEGVLTVVAGRLVPDRQIKWTNPPVRRGRRAGIQNRQRIWRAWQDLRNALRLPADLPEVGGGLDDRTLQRLVRTAEQVLREQEEHLLWSLAT